MIKKDLFLLCLMLTLGWFFVICFLGESQDESMSSKKAKKKTKKKKDSDKRNERREEIAFLSASLIEDWKALKVTYQKESSNRFSLE